MLPVEFKKTLCGPVEFKGQGPYLLCLELMMYCRGKIQDYSDIIHIIVSRPNLCKESVHIGCGRPFTLCEIIKIESIVFESINLV